MPQAVAILFGASFTVVVATALGGLLFKSLSLRLCRFEERVLAFVAGSACLSLLIFGLAALHLARAEVFLIGGLVILAAAAGFGIHRPAAETLPSLPPVWRGILMTGFAFFGALYFFHAMAPEVSPDGSGYHLGLVSRYLRAHGFERITTNMYANLSQGAEMLYLFAFAFGRHSAAALVHFAFTLALPLAMICYGRRFGFPAAGAVGALLVLASPVVGVDGSAAYVDVAAAAVLFSLFYVLQVWDTSGSVRLLVIAGLLAGFAYAVKYTAFLGVPYALAFVGWKLFGDRRKMAKSLAVVGTCALLMMAPWMVKNWIWLGNPFSPFFNHVFPNPHIHAGMEDEYYGHLRRLPVGSNWEIPVEVAARGGASNGLLGPGFLLAPLALLALRHSVGRRLLLAALVFSLPFAANVRTRFLIPPLPFLSLALGIVLNRWPPAATAVALLHLVACWPQFAGSYAAPSAWRLQEIPVRAALRIEPEEKYLESKLALYGLARLIEREVPAGERVLTHTPPPEAYTSREILVGYQAASNNVLRDILWTGVFPGYQPLRSLRFQFPSRVLRKIRLVQQNSHPNFNWSVSELRLYCGFNELMRDSSWRLRASPNPFDVQLAFDGSLATRWRSWEGYKPGMFIEVDLGKPEVVNSIEIDCSGDQQFRLKLLGAPAEGEWIPLGGSLSERLAASLPGIERMVTRELKLRGVDYLLIFDSDPEAAQIRAAPDAWGVRLIKSEGGGTLYRIE